MTFGRDNDSVAEQLLVLRAQLGSIEAYEALAARHDAPVLFYLRRLLGPTADAEDVRQEVWLTVIRKLRTLDDPGAFRSWLYMVARRHALTLLRRRHRELPLDDLPESEQPVVPDDTDEPLGYSAEDAAAVFAALDALAPHHREVLSLRYLNELTYEQIADVLGRRVGTVRSRIHYAKAALRAAIPHIANHAARSAGVHGDSNDP